MNMQILTGAIGRLPEFAQLCAAMEGGACPVVLSGVAAVHRAHIAAGLNQIAGQPVIMVCADEGEAQRLARDLAALTGKEVPTLLSRAFTFHRSAALSHQWEQKRLGLMDALSRGEVPVLVATVESLLQPTLAPETLEACRMTISVGGVAELNELTESDRKSVV